MPPTTMRYKPKLPNKNTPQRYEKRRSSFPACRLNCLLYYKIVNRRNSKDTSRKQSCFCVLSLCVSLLLGILEEHLSWQKTFRATLRLRGVMNRNFLYIFQTHIHNIYYPILYSAYLFSQIKIQMFCSCQSTSICCFCRKLYWYIL